MKVQFQPLGRSLVLVLDGATMSQHGVEPGSRYRLEVADDRLIFHRLADQTNPEQTGWEFEEAQAWITAKYAPAFRVLAR